MESMLEQNYNQQPPPPEKKRIINKVIIFLFLFAKGLLQSQFTERCLVIDWNEIQI